MATSVGALLLACVVCAGQAGRVQPFIPQDATTDAMQHRQSVQGTHKAMKSLAKFLLAFNLAAVFQLDGRMTKSSHHAALSRLNQFGRHYPAWQGSDIVMVAEQNTASSAWELPLSWQEPLAEYLASEEFASLRAAVDAERARGSVLPTAEEQLAAFRACDFEAVRVVLLGQDPYPTPGHPMGLAFSVRPDVSPLPGSLRNIYKELVADGFAPPASGSLSGWAAQGVFLLNAAALSVREGEPDSHTKLGWDGLTNAAIAALGKRRTGLVFMLWGKKAQAKATLVPQGHEHLMLTAPHPSPLAAHRGFFGCKHFSQANSFLASHGKEEVRWSAGGGEDVTNTRPQTEVTRQRDYPVSVEASSLSTQLLLIFDTETTGVETETARVVQLGACYWRGSGRVGRLRSMLVNPGCSIPPEASSVHGITDADVAGAQNFGFVSGRFAAHVSGQVDAESGVASDGLREGREAPLLCGYNALAYDVPVMLTEAGRHGVELPIEQNRVLDPLVWIRWYHRDWPKRDLTSAAARFGFDLSNAHSAAADAEATGAVVNGLIREGTIPDNIVAMFSEQELLAARLEEERNEYGYVLYRDRSKPWTSLSEETALLERGASDMHALRVGFGKHVGKRLEEVDKGYLQYCLEKFDDLTHGARIALSAAAGTLDA